MNVQWYPGHMTKAKRQMLEDLKLIDLVIELIDARTPVSSRNPDIDEMARGKARLVLLNKADLADEAYTRIYKASFEEKGFTVCTVNSLKVSDVKQIQEPVQKVCAAKIERDRKRGIRNRPVRAMIAGIPNVGKSTFINTFARRGVARTGNKPGVTRGKQWIRMSSTLELLDTPGILWPKFEDPKAGIRLALIGSIRDEILPSEELAMELIRLMQDLYPGVLHTFYGIESGETAEDADQILEQIAIVRGCIGKGGTADCGRAAMMLLENFRNGKIGCFTLDREGI